MTALLLTVTIVSLIVAGIATWVAWRVTRDEHRRSNARVAALSNAIYGDADDVEDSVTPSRSMARYGLIAVGAVVAIGVAAAMSGGLFRRATAATVKEPPHVRKADAAPLELLALEHERDGNRFVVRGLVRNPANGAVRDGLTAVVLAYTRTGDLLASGRAAVLVSRLAPGETTPFVVNVAVGDAIDRFRVSFRTGTRVESHVDRRPRGDAAKEADP